MTLEDLEQLEATLDPTARMVIAFLREHVAQLSKQLDSSTEQNRLLTEQITRLVSGHVDPRKYGEGIWGSGRSVNDDWV